VPEFLKSTAARAATLALILQGALLYSSMRPEYAPEIRPLSEFPQSLGAWEFYEDGVVDQETRDILKADDLLSRVYVNPATRRGATLFVAAFRTQRTGAAPHSPKNCLPGSGWTPLLADELTFNAGSPQPITVNRYIVAHGEQRSLVLYWYQSRDRIVANEFKAKFWVMADAIRWNRTDTALVRVVIPLREGEEDEATAAASDFVRAFFAPLHEFLPA
jgi:EpsI family protein